MIIPVKCFTCGKVIGNKYLYFKRVVRAEKLKKSIDPDDVIYLTEDNRKKTELELAQKEIQKQKLAELEKTSLDFYATIRSLYRQKRADEIRNGESGDAVPIPEITLELDEPLTNERATQTSQVQ